MGAVPFFIKEIKSLLNPFYYNTKRKKSPQIKRVAEINFGFLKNSRY